jgi:hypothetical protein
MGQQGITSGMGNGLEIAYPKNGAPIAWGAQNAGQAANAINASNGSIAQKTIADSRKGLFAQGNPLLTSLLGTGGLMNFERPKEQTFEAPVITPPAPAGANTHQGSFTPLAPNLGLRGFEPSQHLTPEQMKTLTAYRPDLLDNLTGQYNPRTGQKQAEYSKQINGINDFFSSYYGGQ